jgi:hypothetical protein
MLVPKRGVTFAFSSSSFEQRAYIFNGEMFFLLPNPLMADPGWFSINLES